MNKAVAFHWGPRAGRPDARVVIRADAALPYGQVAALLADVTGSGFTRVALVNQPRAIPAESGEEPAG